MYRERCIKDGAENAGFSNSNNVGDSNGFIYQELRKAITAADPDSVRRYPQQGFGQLYAALSQKLKVPGSKKKYYDSPLKKYANLALSLRDLIKYCDKEESKYKIKYKLDKIDEGFKNYIYKGIRYTMRSRYADRAVIGERLIQNVYNYLTSEKKEAPLQYCSCSKLSTPYYWRAGKWTRTGFHYKTKVADFSNKFALVEAHCKNVCKNHGPEENQQTKILDLERKASVLEESATKLENEVQKLE